MRSNGARTEPSVVATELAKTYRLGKRAAADGGRSTECRCGAIAGARRSMLCGA